jgi:hypothetical protein
MKKLEGTIKNRTEQGVYSLFSIIGTNPNRRVTMMNFNKTLQNFLVNITYAAIIV